jgi:hypothetical protein
MSRPLLVYDGQRDIFRRVADGVTSLIGDVQPIPWESARVQQFLDAQFDEKAFVFMIVEDEYVHVGDRAVQRLGELSELSAGLINTLSLIYPSVAGPFGLIVHGNKPSDIHGSFELHPTAQEIIAPLRSPTEIPLTTKHGESTDT